MAKINDNIVYVANHASNTSRKAAEKVLPKTGTMRKAIFDAIANHGGLADFEIEALLKGKHQSISAGRRGLVIDNFIIDSGRTRKNESGNECTVWVVQPTEWKLF
jgi:hypothetical protein